MFIIAADHELQTLNCITVELLYNGHLGDRRKWPLERDGHCREVLKKSQCKDFLSAGMEKSGCCKEVGVSGSSTAFHCSYTIPLPPPPSPFKERKKKKKRQLNLLNHNPLGPKSDQLQFSPNNINT